MTILIYFLTIVFGIVCFVIMKKKRYKVMPLICLIMFICFIGCGIVSILSLTLPYGEILVYPLGAIIFGLVFILVGVNDLYSLLRCREKVDGVYCGYNTYYGGNGISTQSPIFEYTYNGTYYREQTAQNISHKRLNRSMTRGNVYSIYIDPKHPAVFILAKKIKIGDIFSEENITCKRPGNGISPLHWYDVLGKVAERDFEEDELIIVKGFEWQE